MSRIQCNGWAARTKGVAAVKIWWRAPETESHSEGFTCEGGQSLRRAWPLGDGMKRLQRRADPSEDHRVQQQSTGFLQIEDYKIWVGKSCRTWLKSKRPLFDAYRESEREAL